MKRASIVQVQGIMRVKSRMVSKTFSHEFRS